MPITKQMIAIIGAGGNTGFNPVHAGDLSARGTLEGTQQLLTNIMINNDHNRPASWKILHD